MYNNLDYDAIDLTQAPPTEEPQRQAYFIAKCRQYVNGFKEKFGRYPTAVTQTFGCQMNARDSEKLMGILEQIGYEIVQEEEKADFVIYNTCTVRDNANQKVYGRLGYLKNYKKKNPHLLIAMCGCMMQEQVVIDKIKKSYRYVDIIFGTHNVFKLAELLYERLTSEDMIIDIWQESNAIVEDLPVDRKYAFKSGVNIMYGCNNFCSYCIVPYVRGRERSRKPEEILAEVRRLASEGVTEVMLLGQNVNSYGKSLETPMSFASLLEEVEKVDGIERIRFMTSHPKDLSEELIQVMKKSKKICRHLHLPLQSGSSRILKEMNRRYDKEKYLALAARIKEEIPDIALTTDIIVGFPGETEEDFEETLDVVRKVRYDSAFTFIYSKRTGTPAAAMENQIPEEVSKVRFQKLLRLVQEIAAEECAKRVGQVQSVLVEEKSSREGMMTGRLSGNSVVHFVADESVMGKIVDVKLVEAKGFYYIGELQEV
jgi:tRNA-2-methylthio-N6-dimethylallyladenosine synthase